MPSFKDMKSWRDRLGHSGLRSFTDSKGYLWVEQNAAKASKWAKLAREAHADRRRDLHRIGGDEKVHAAEAVAAGISICATEARHSPATPCHCLTGTR